MLASLVNSCLSASARLRRTARWNVLLPGFLLLLIAAANMRQPLTGTHWDSPIWLYQARGFADTPYLESVARCARASAGRSDVPYCYYPYSRLGHTAILGSVVKSSGSNSTAIHVASLLYYFLLFFGVVLTGLSVTRLHDTSPTRQADGSAVHRGVFVSCLLYLSSELFSYLGNSLVSDVPSLALVALAGFLLNRGLATRSHRHLFFGGICGALAYAVRIESIWAYVSLMLALSAVHGLRNRRQFWWFGLLCAATYLAALLALYAAAVHPLGDPTIYLQWARIVNQHWATTNDAEAGWLSLLRAGAMLWPGLLICLALRKLSAPAAIGMAWLALLMVPWLPWLFISGPTQTRHYSLVALPLIYISSSGWTELFRVATGRAGRVALTASVMLAIAFNLTIREYPSGPARSMPGVWRLDGTTGLKALQPPSREQATYWIGEALDLGREVYRADRRTVVLRSERLPVEDFVYLMAFLSPARQATPDFLKDASGPENFVDCDEAVSKLNSATPVLYVVHAKPGCRALLNAQGIRLLNLAYRGPGEVAAPGTLVLATPHYALHLLD